MGECMGKHAMKSLKEVDFWLHSKNLGLKLIEQNYMYIAIHMCIYIHIMQTEVWWELYIIASWIYFLVRYTYNPIKMIKISTAVTTMPSKIKEITVVPTGYVN